MLPVSGCRSDTRPALVMSTPGQLVHTSKGRAPLMYYTLGLPDASQSLHLFPRQTTISGTTTRHTPQSKAADQACRQANQTAASRLVEHVSLLMPTTKPYPKAFSHAPSAILAGSAQLLHGPLSRPATRGLHTQHMQPEGAWAQKHPEVPLRP